MNVSREIVQGQKLKMKHMSYRSVHQQFFADRHNLKIDTMAHILESHSRDMILRLAVSWSLIYYFCKGRRVT